MEDNSAFVMLIAFGGICGFLGAIVGKFFPEEDRENKGCVGLPSVKALRAFLLDIKRLGCANVVLDFEMAGPWHGNSTGVDEFIGLLDAQLG